MKHGGFLQAGYLGRRPGVKATLAGLLWSVLLSILFGIFAYLPVVLIFVLAGQSIDARAETLPPALQLLRAGAFIAAQFAAVVVVVDHWLDRSPRTLVTLNERFAWPRAIEAGLIWMLLVLLFLVLPAYLFGHDGGPRLNLLRLIMWLPAVLAFALLQAGSEEVVFRGYLLQSFGRVLPTGAAIVAVSVLFALLHTQYALPGKISLALLSVFACWLAWRDNGLERAIGLHVGNNLLFFALYRGTGTPVFLAQPDGRVFGTSWTYPLASVAMMGLFLLLSDRVWPRLRRRLAAAFARTPTQPA